MSVVETRTRPIEDIVVRLFQEARDAGVVGEADYDWLASYLRAAYRAGRGDKRAESDVAARAREVVEVAGGGDSEFGIQSTHDIRFAPVDRLRVFLFGRARLSMRCPFQFDQGELGVSTSHVTVPRLGFSRWARAFLRRRQNHGDAVNLAAEE